MTGFPTNDQIYSHIKELTKWGHRKTGTAEGRNSAEYIAGKFNEYGLKDVSIEKVKCDVCTPEYWDLIVNGSSIPSYYINGTFKNGKLGRNSLGKNGMTKEIVYLGEGWEKDFEEKDVKDKIVVCDIRFKKFDDQTILEYAPVKPHIYDPDNVTQISRNRRDIFSPYNWPYNYFYAQVRGAAGFIGILTDYFDSCEYYNEDYLEFAVGFDMETMSLPGLWISKSSGEKLKQQIQGKKSEATIIMDSVCEEKDALNVYGILPGESPEIILAHSHHDAVYDGAVQDGSGISEMLALAEYYSKSDKKDRAKTLMFAATDTHFEGYIAHQDFIDRRKDEKQDIILDVSIEHIGKEVELDENNNAVLTGYTDTRVFYVSGSSKLMDIATNSIEKNDLQRSLIFGIPAKKDRIVDETHEFKQDEIISDAFLFHKAGTGVVSVVSPQMYIFHPSDKLDKVAFEDLQSVGLTFRDIIDEASKYSKDELGVIGLID